MTTVTLRPMTSAEFEQWQDRLTQVYAKEQVEAGRWPREGAVQRALDESAGLLPQGLDTSRMLVLRGCDADGEPVGRAWVALDGPRSIPGAAFLYDSAGYDVVTQQMRKTL